MISGGYESPRDLSYFRPDAPAEEEILQLNGSLNADRVYHTSGLLPNGRVIIVGGSYNNSSPTSDILDLVTETVVAGPNMTQSRYAPSGTSLNSKFYVCGCYNIYDATCVAKQCEVYDPKSKDWQPIASSDFNHDTTDLGREAVEQNY